MGRIEKLISILYLYLEAGLGSEIGEALAVKRRRIEDESFAGSSLEEMRLSLDNEPQMQGTKNTRIYRCRER